jgi:predicted DNA-binding protein (MmcQ/YjbR family)
VFVKEMTMTRKLTRGLDAAGLKALCARWPGVTDDIKWESNLVMSVCGKMFAMMPLDEGDGARLSFKVADERFLELTDRADIVPAPYLARAHWVAVNEPKRFNTETLQDFVRDAYGVVRGKLSRKLQTTLGPLPTGKGSDA